MRLEPLSFDHTRELVAAATEDRSTYRFTYVPASEEQMRDHISELLAAWEQGTDVPFVQVATQTGRPVGMTRYLSARRRPGAATPFAVEIGGTWLAGSAQRRGLNREAKLLLLTYAFESWGVARVDLKTDARNERSRRAIEGTGARFEGVLRSWQPSLVPGEEAAYRDTAMHSVVAQEWPAVKLRLEQLLAGAGSVGPAGRRVSG